MRTRTLLVVLVVAAGTFTACGREGGQRLDVVAHDFGFSGIDRTIDGGTIDLTFRNEGQAQHEFALIRADDVDVDAFIEGFAPVLKGGPFPDFAPTGSVPGEIGPGETLRTRFTLPAGEYMLMCALTDEPGGEGDDQPQGDAHYELGMIRPLTVQGNDDVEPISSAAGTFVASDYTFTTPDDVRPGTSTYTFRNASDEQWHHMVLSVFEAGVTPEQATEAFTTMISLEDGEAPPEGTPQPEEAGATGIFGPGLSQSVELTFEAGRTYIAQCFIQDTTGGPPHAIAHRMFKAFTVSER